MTSEVLYGQLPEWTQRDECFILFGGCWGYGVSYYPSRWKNGAELSLEGPVLASHDAALLNFPDEYLEVLHDYYVVGIKERYANLRAFL